MTARTQRWVDQLFGLTAVRLIVWFSITVSAYPGVLLNPYKLATWFDDHALYAFDEVDRITVLRYGQLPAWNPYWCGGSPGIAEPEDAFYSPDFLLRLIFGTEHGRRLAILLFFVLAMEGTYRLCRRLDSSAVASAFGAVVFATCDRFLPFIRDGWVHFLSFGLVPWVLLALLNGVTSVAWRVAGGFFFAWIVLAPGTYPAPYAAVAFGYCLLALFAYRFFRHERAPFKGPLLAALTIGVVALLLAACKLVPTVLYMREFPRQFSPIEVHTAAATLGPFVTRYGGVVLFALAGVIVGDLAAGICVGGALMFFLLSLGESEPLALFTLMKKLPLLSQLRFPDRFSVMVLFFTALAASRGLTRLEDALPRAVSATWRWLSTRPWRGAARRELPWLDALARRSLPAAAGWIAVGAAAIVAWRLARPVADELIAAPRAGSIGLFVEEPPHPLEQEFKQSRGNRRDAHIFPALNMGSLYCVAGIPIPESARLRGDLPQEEYPADPAVAEVKRVSWSPNVIVLDVNAKASTTIYVNQNWSPKWRASVGTVRSEEGLLAVDVPAGHMTLRLDYRDDVLYVSALISLGTLLVIGWFGGRRLARAAKREWTRFESLDVWPAELAGPAGPAAMNAEGEDTQDATASDEPDAATTEAASPTSTRKESDEQP